MMLSLKNRSFWELNRHWKCSPGRELAKRRPSRPNSRCYAAAVDRKPSQRLPTTPARTRFAPSPTGNLHLGSLRTALFNYLLAKATSGQFILRIEDTDQKRSVSDSEESICQDLKWAGLEWDEGPGVGGPYGPYKQSERTALYREHADRLLESGHAYRCFCPPIETPECVCAGISKEESDDGASKGRKHAVRLRAYGIGREYDDLVYGKVGDRRNARTDSKYSKSNDKDFILLKSDGLPTYHLANVVDDHYMEITHVIRAVEWMPSTARHIAMYKALGWTFPQYAHVGLLLDDKGQKLSKRYGTFGIESYRRKGILPEALINHAVLLGWHHSLDRDFLTLDRMIQIFDLKFTKGNAVVNSEKLEYLQRKHAQCFIEEGGNRFESIVEDVLSCFIKKSEKHARSIQEDPGPDGVPKLVEQLNWVIPDKEREARDYISSLLKADFRAYFSPALFLDRNSNFFRLFFNRPESPLVGVKDTERQMMYATINSFLKDDSLPWNEASIRVAIIVAAHTVMERGFEHAMDVKDVKIRLVSFLRWAIMGSKPGPPMEYTMAVLGRNVTIRRWEAALIEAG